jgi:DNA-binding XRE family transcriptional regulator
MNKSVMTNIPSRPRRHASGGDEPELVALGQTIRQARTQQGLTQAQLALVSGISRDTLIALENGRSGVSLGLALQALRGLGMTLVPASRGAG